MRNYRGYRPFYLSQEAFQHNMINPEWQKGGSKIRNIRIKLDLTIQKIESEHGFDKILWSQLERGVSEMKPSIMVEMLGILDYYKA